MYKDSCLFYVFFFFLKLLFVLIHEVLFGYGITIVNITKFKGRSAVSLEDDINFPSIQVSKFD